MQKSNFILAIDIGNTQCKLAIMQNYFIVEKLFCEHKNLKATISKLSTKHIFEHFIICNVVQTMQKTMQAIAKKNASVILTHTSKIPFKSKYASMSTLGLDRIALIAATQQKFKNSNTLVIALGTCITYNFINSKNIFLGGAIAPGMQMRYKAMHYFTKGLPLVNATKSIKLLGIDTITCLQSGVQNGIIAELNHVISQYSAKYQNLNVVLTGGDMLTFATQIKYKIFADANFQFYGLYEIYKNNTN